MRFTFSERRKAENDVDDFEEEPCQYVMSIDDQKSKGSFTVDD